MSIPGSEYLPHVSLKCRGKSNEVPRHVDIVAQYVQLTAFLLSRNVSSRIAEWPGKMQPVSTSCENLCRIRSAQNNLVSGSTALQFESNIEKEKKANVPANVSVICDNAPITSDDYASASETLTHRMEASAEAKRTRA